MKTCINISIIFVLLWTADIFAGDLEPSAAPGSTMKTLDEVEPRIPITQGDIPLTISSPGSYYLAGDVTAAATAITVSADNVTIDLMGYSVTGPGAGYGVNMASGENIEIRNGTITNFQTGIYDGSSTGGGHRIINVRAESNTCSGIILYGTACMIKDCTVYNNGQSSTSIIYGIYTYTGALIAGNVIAQNGSETKGNFYGIYAGYGAAIKGNQIYHNADSSQALYNYGIYAYSGCSIIDNGIFGNAGYAVGNFYGIHTYYAGTISGNTVNTNAGSSSGSVYGIKAGSGAAVNGNSVCHNGSSSSSSVIGIYLTSYNLADQNSSYGNAGTNMQVGADCVLGSNVAP